MKYIVTEQYNNGNTHKHIINGLHTVRTIWPWLPKYIPPVTELDIEMTINGEMVFSIKTVE